MQKNDNDTWVFGSVKALKKLLGWMYLLAYLDPTSNPGSKPQKLSAKNFKTSTSDELQKFFAWDNRFLFWRGILGKRNPRTFQEDKEENQWFDRKYPVLMAVWLYPT